MDILGLAVKYWPNLPWSVRPQEVEKLDAVDPLFYVARCKTPWQYKTRKRAVVDFWRETCGLPKEIPLRRSHEAYYYLHRAQVRETHHERMANLALVGYFRDEHLDPAFFD